MCGFTTSGSSSIGRSTTARAQTAGMVARPARSAAEADEPLRGSERDVAGFGVAADGGLALRARGGWFPGAVERFGSGPVEPEVHGEPAGCGRGEPVGFQIWTRCVAADVDVE